MNEMLENGDFHAGLQHWEATPNGVSLVSTANSRMLLLAGESSDAAVRSMPIAAKAGARYRIATQIRLAGEFEIRLLDEKSEQIPDSEGEFVANSDRVIVQLRCKRGSQIGISKVSLLPVGPRVVIRSVRDTYPFTKLDEPFQLIAELVNEGSETIERAAIRFIGSSHKLFEEHKQEQQFGPLRVGERIEIGWTIAGQRRAVSPFAIELEYAGRTAKHEGFTLRHRPARPDDRVVASVVASRRMVSIANRSLRITARETDLDLGMALVSDERARVDLGILRQLAQLRIGSAVMPLWSAFKKATTLQAELVGKNQHAEWALKLYPDHFERAVMLEVRYKLSRRTENVSLELFPFQTQWPMRIQGQRVLLAHDAGGSWLEFQGVRGSPLTFIASAESGTTFLRSESSSVMPASWHRIAGMIRIV